MVTIMVRMVRIMMMWCRHRWTGRYEAHLWDNSCRKEGQTRKGRQGTTTAFISGSWSDYRSLIVNGQYNLTADHMCMSKIMIACICVYLQCTWVGMTRRRRLLGPMILQLSSIGDPPHTSISLYDQNFSAFFWSSPNCSYIYATSHFLKAAIMIIIWHPSSEIWIELATLRKYW